MDKEKWKALFKSENKKLKVDLLMVFALGILLILLGNSFFMQNKPQQPAVQETAKPLSEDSNTVQSSGEGSLEKRLKNILSKVQGAGTIEVMVTTGYSSEMIVAEDKKEEKSTTTETASVGDERVIENVKSENSVVLLEGKDGSVQPLILKEGAPKVLGVVIVAEGADDVIVRDALSKAAEALLDVPAHKIQVLKMK